MKIIKYYNEFINEEAIPYSDVKPYLEIERSESVIKKINEIFDKLKNIDRATTSKRGDRVYIQYTDNSDIEMGEVQLEIEDVLNKNGYTISDYEKGLCVSGKGVTIKIGKLLNRLDLKKLLNNFNNDKNREGVKNKEIESYIVFSKHPYDIVGMSTGRGWTSCMNIYKDEKKDYVKVDIELGSIIVYLVNSDDLNINNPKSRILIKPFINRSDENDVIYLSDEIYGTTSNEFKKSVDDILNSIQEINIGIYNLKKGLYMDTMSVLFNIREFKTKKQVIDVLNILEVDDYKINDDLTVDVDGSVYISSLGLDRIPINFNKVSGHFYCRNNKLTDLKGSPKSVGGDFYCYNNKLTSLDDAPKSIKGNFSCYNNKLNDLKGAPELMNKNFNCSNNQLITLEGAPKSVGGSFDCSNNKLTDLVGGPKSVGDNFYCKNNRLLTLKGMPYNVVRDFVYHTNPVYYLLKLIGDIEYINTVVINNKLDLNKLNSLLKEMGKSQVSGVKGYEII